MEDLHGESQKCLPLRLPTEGEGGLEYLSPWKTFLCLVWMPRPLQAGQCSAPTLWLSDPWLGARVSGHGGDNETPQNQTNFQSPISPRFRNRPFYPSPRAGIKMTNQTFYSSKLWLFSLELCWYFRFAPPPIILLFFCMIGAASTTKWNKKAQKWNVTS